MRENMDNLKKLFKQFYLSLLITFCSLLGALGGVVNKDYRRFALPLILTLYVMFKLPDWRVLSMLFMMLAFSIGYGIPDYVQEIGNKAGWGVIYTGDKGSVLGRFFMNLFHNNTILSNLACRGSVAIIIILSCLSIPFIKHNYIPYGVYSVIFLCLFAYISWQSWGIIPFRGKELNVVDLICYSLVGIYVILIVK
jgi:hypothetical protein